MRLVFPERQLFFGLFLFCFLECQTTARQVGIARCLCSIEQAFDCEYLKLREDGCAEAFVEAESGGFFLHCCCNAKLMIASARNDEAIIFARRSPSYSRARWYIPFDSQRTGGFPF